MVGKSSLLGTIDAGKLADVIILTANPLDNAANLRSVETVILDGRVIERGYHAGYRDPFLNLGDPSVDALQWFVALKASGRGGGAGTLSDPPMSPQPGIQSLAPLIVTQGEESVVRLVGVNFVRRSEVLFDGRRVASRVVSPTEIDVTLGADDLRAVGKFPLVVRNPEPIDPTVVRNMWGTGTSNAARLIVNYRY
jgi:hypothetical protein